MLANVFFGIALLCVFCAGVVTGRGWRQWGDDGEFAPGTAGLVVLNLFAAVCCLVARSLA